MSSGLYSGQPGLSLGTGLYRAVSSLWSGASGLVTGFGGPVLSLDFLSGSPDSRITFTRGTTATFVGSNGLIQTAAINTPRFDYDPVTLAPKGLLIEEQRTNLLLRSQEFDNSAWLKNAATIASNVTTAPDGTSTAEKLIADSGSLLSSSYARQPITKNASPTTYTSSIYAKAAEYNRIRFTVRDNSSGSNNAAVTVSLVDGSIVSAAAATGTFSNASATVTSAGNGWYRIALSYTTGSETSIWGGTPFASDATATTGDGTSGIFIWGAQLEAGAFATSYIPTVASTVTRSADVALMQGANFSNWYNQSEGTLVSAFSSFTPTGVSQAAWTISDGTNNERWFVFCPSTAIRHFMVDGGVTQASIDVGTYAANSVFKSAMAIRLNSVQAAVNGVLGTEDTNATIPTVDRLGFGTAPSAATGFLNGHIRSIQYYNTRLPNAQLQALTS